MDEGAQVEAYNLQFTIYNLQFTIYNLQFTIYNLQFTIYNLQFMDNKGKYFNRNLSWADGWWAVTLDGG